MKKTRLILIISILILSIVVIGSNYSTAVTSSNLEEKLKTLINQYREALIEDDIDTIRRISNEEFTQKHEELFEEYDSIYVRLFRLDSYRKEEGTNKIIVNITHHYLTVKEGIPRITSTHRGDSTLTVEKRESGYYLVDTNLYRGSNPFIRWVVLPAVFIAFVIIPSLKKLGLWPEKLSLWSKKDE